MRRPAQDYKDNEWRKRALRSLPELAARVFALRQSFYTGKGFHYALEKTLGSTIRTLNDYDKSLRGCDAVIAQVIHEEVWRDMRAAERDITRRKAS